MTEAASAEYLNLKVKSQDGEEVFFKIKKATQFKKLMDAYCSRQNVKKTSKYLAPNLKCKIPL